MICLGRLNESVNRHTEKPNGTRCKFPFALLGCTLPSLIIFILDQFHLPMNKLKGYRDEKKNDAKEPQRERNKE